MISEEAEKRLLDQYRKANTLLRLIFETAIAGGEITDSWLLVQALEKDYPLSFFMPTPDWFDYPTLESVMIALHNGDISQGYAANIITDRGREEIAADYAYWLECLEKRKTLDQQRPESEKGSANG